MREIDLMDRIRELARGDLRLFRNDVGFGTNARGLPVRYGLHPGSPDLIGWKRVTVTPDMIGQTIAVAVGLEVKTESGRLRSDQRVFLDHMQDFGALAGVARSIEEAKSICGL